MCGSIPPLPHKGSMAYCFSTGTTTCTLWFSCFFVRVWYLTSHCRETELIIHRWLRTMRCVKRKGLHTVSGYKSDNMQQQVASATGFKSNIVIVIILRITRTGHVARMKENQNLHIKFWWGNIKVKKGKSKAVPLQGWTDFVTTARDRMVVGCQPYAPAAFTPRKYSWYSFLLEAESTPGP